MNAPLLPQTAGALRIPEGAACTCGLARLPASCPSCRAFRLVHSEVHQRQRTQYMEPRQSGKGSRK